MSNSSTTTAPQKTRPRVIRTVLLTLGVLFLIYVLSEGLAYRLYRKDVISYQTYASAYSPFFYLSHRYAWFDDLDSRYEELWYDDAKAISDDIKKEMTKEGYIVK